MLLMNVGVCVTVSEEAKLPVDTQLFHVHDALVIAR